jgi:DNA primase
VRSTNGAACGARGGGAWPPGSLADLKAQVDLVDFAGRHTALKRQGDAWWGSCPFHRDRTPSFRVDPRRQNYRCWGCGARGDAIDFLAAVENLDAGAAIRQLRELVGGRPADPRVRAARKAEEDTRGAVEAEAKRTAAQRFWRESLTLDGGAPWVYLTQVRGLSRWDFDRLRYHPACGFGWIEEPPFGFKSTAPAIIAPVTSHATGCVVGIWRIRLTPAGGLVRRLGLGDTQANAARLSEPEGDELALAEGVEDALAFHELEGMPTWAALSAGNMVCLILPPRFRRVVIVQDNDPADRRGRRPGPDAAQALARRLLAEGRKAEIVKAKNAKDANDVLHARRGAT